VSATNFAKIHEFVCEIIILLIEIDYTQTDSTEYTIVRTVGGWQKSFVYKHLCYH